MTTSFADRFRNNARIQTSSSDLPEFPGMFVMASGQSGSLGIGSDVKTVNSITNIEFITHFTMNRLAFKPNKDETFNTNYVIAGEKTPYVLDYKGHSYIADSRKDLIYQLGLDEDMLKQQQIFVGYAVNANRQKVPTAQAIWYVSRGNNAYRLNEKLKDFGSLTARTLINVINNREEYKNKAGGTNFVLDFEITEFPEEKTENFLTWSDQISQKIEQYRLEMITASQNIVNAAKEAQQHELEAKQQPQGNVWGQQGQPTQQPQYTAPSQPSRSAQQQAPANPFGSQQQAPTNLLMSGQPSNQAPANPFGGGDEIVIDDDDLPF